MTNMNDNAPLDGAESHADGLSTPPEGDGAGSIPPEPQKGNKEARYRVERNQAREELVAANARIERMQRAEVERLAADALSHPADLFSLSGNELADYLTDDGDVDAEKVAADVAAILAERPGMRKQSPAFDPSQGHGGPPKAAQAEPSIAAMIKGTVAGPLGVHAGN